MNPRPVTLAWRVVKITVVLLATWFLAIPQVPQVARAVRALAAAPDPMVLLAGGCALAALLSYAQLTRAVLGDGTRPGLLHTFGIITTSLGISNLLPAGSAAGGVLAFRMLERAGVARARAGVAMVVTSLGSTAVLNVLLVLGMIALLPTHGFATGALLALPSAAIVGSLVLVGRGIVRRDPWLWRAAAWVERHLPFVRDGQLGDGLSSVAVQLEDWRHRPGLVCRAAFWATVNWLVDVVALWALLRAVGVHVDPPAVLVAFAVANLAAVVPITPGGLGVVEVTLTATLVALGAPAAPAALGVAAYRVFNYWLPIPTSALTYATTRWLTRGRGDQPAAAAPGAAGIVAS